MWSDLILQREKGTITFENIERGFERNKLVFIEDTKGKADIYLVHASSATEILVETLKGEKIYIKIKNINSIKFLGGLSVFQEIRKRQETINHLRSVGLNACDAADELKKALKEKS